MAERAFREGACDDEDVERLNAKAAQRGLRRAASATHSRIYVGRSGGERLRPTILPGFRVSPH
jgi:hypothetical protein